MIYLILLAIILRSTVSRPIVFIMTHEGLSSHVHQVQRLWGKAQTVNRGVELVNFNSYHYDDAGPICLCDIFIFPISVHCTRVQLATVHKNHKCILIQEHETWSSHPSHYLLPQNVKRDSKFSFKDVDCVAGFYGSEGLLPTTVNKTSFPTFDNLAVSLHYKSMLPALLKDLGLSGQSFVVMHWRRGDQLQYRCPELSTHTIAKDLSVNCHSVYDFIKVTKSLLKRENITARVFVATNEQSPLV